MSVLSDFFVSEEAGVPTYGTEDSTIPPRHCCQFKGITVLQAAQILAALRGVPYHVDLIREFPDVPIDDDDDGPWTVRLPDDMVALLSDIKESAFSRQAEAWSEVTFEVLGWSGDDFIEVVREVVRLARLAKASEQHVYLWNCL